MKKKLILLVTAILVSFYSTQAQLVWQQIGSDITNIGGYGYYNIFGQTVSISSDGSVVAITSNKIFGGAFMGIVKVYKNNAENWVQIGSDIGGTSISSVSLSSDGSVVATGIPIRDEKPVLGSDAGRTRVYENNSGIWQQIGIDINGEVYGDYSGYSVSLSSDGSVVAMGAPFNSGNGTSVGHVRVYKNNSGIWLQIGQDIDGVVAGGNFGSCVSLSYDGTVVAVGANYIYGSETTAGNVKLYKNNSGTWQQIGSDIVGQLPGDRSGYSISLNFDGSIVAIGAPGNNYDEIGTDAGQVKVYKNTSGTWVQIGSDIDGEAAGDNSGCSVSLSSDGSIVAIGAPGDDENGTNAGHVRIYKNISGTWQQIGPDINGEAEGDAAGGSVSLSSDGSVVVIGSPGHNNGTLLVDQGQARVFKCVYGNVGMNDLTHSGISISPNPTKDKISITGNSDKTIENITITDITGKTVIKRSDIKQNGEIELSGLGKGIYIIALQTEKEIVTTKIIKE